MQLPDGRHAELIALGGAHSAPLLNRIAAELPAAADAVSAFWGPDWRREVVVVATASDPQFAALAGGEPTSPPRPPPIASYSPPVRPP